MLCLLNQAPKYTVDIIVNMFSDKVYCLQFMLHLVAITGHYSRTELQPPSHTARNTINFLHQENVNFIEPDMWPPNSPYLNPVDYAIRGAL